MKTETVIQREIMDYLKTEEIWHKRMATQGNMHTFGGRTFRKANPNKGMADILASFDNKFFWIEVKTPVGRLSPEQIAFRKEVEAEGHFYMIARTADDVRNVLEQVFYKNLV